MKYSLLTAALLALVVAATLSSAMAQESKPTGACPGSSQRVDPGASNAMTTTAHYEYQYGYDRHSHWRGHWVLVR
jgi:hypothetical protein